MSKTQRQISLARMGGSKLVYSLPPHDRALVLASLMEESPAKNESRVACALCAFRDAVEKGNPSRASWIFRRHKLGESSKAEEALALVSGKIEKLKSEGEKQLADSFAIRFFKDEEAISRLSDWGARCLAQAGDEMKMGDYPFTYVLLNQIIDVEAKSGLSIHTHEAAALLAICYLRAGDIKKAAEVVAKHLHEKDIFGRTLKFIEASPKNQSALEEELGKYIFGVSEGCLKEAAKIADADSYMLQLCQKAIAKIAEKDADGLDELEKRFNIAMEFGLERKALSLTGTLIPGLAERANSQPEKFYQDYLHAARIAKKIKDHEKMGECASKFLSLCTELGKSNPSIYVEGFNAAIEFRKLDSALSLGQMAFDGLVSQGDYFRAGGIMIGMGWPVTSPQMTSASNRMSSILEEIKRHL